MKIKLKFLLLCLSTQFIISQNNCLIIGHRGASGYKPENTLLSFKTAIDMNVDMIELDVYKCKTGELVVFHDDKIDRMTNDTGYITNKTFNQLRQLTVTGNEKIPTLQEAIELINKQVILNIELKGSDTEKPVANLLKKYIERGWKQKDFIISSFNVEQIKNFKKIYPEIQTGALFSYKTLLSYQALINWLSSIFKKNNSYIVEQALKANANFIGIDNSLVSQKLINNAHACDLDVYVFTINTKQRADELRKLKIDGIFSNYPDKIK